MEVIISSRNPKLGLFSGIHGDEWGVIESVQKAIKQHTLELSSFLFIPECSPSAVKLKSRINGEGVDLNRSFLKDPESQEVQKIISVLKPFTFDLCVDFHEDVELSGVYLYDSVNIEGSNQLSRFRQEVRKIAPLYSGVDDTVDQQLGGKAYEGYRVSLPPTKDDRGDYVYEGFFDYWALIEGKAKRWMTLEVPTRLSQKKKDTIVDTFFRIFLIIPYHSD